MTGLNLEPFLRLLRADVGAWASLGMVAVLLGLVAWTGWGSRRVLRKCLVLSVLAHVGFAFFGGEELSRLMSGGVPDGTLDDEPGIREIRVTAVSTASDGAPDAGASGPGGRGGALAPDRDLAAFALATPADPELRAPRPDPVPTEPARPQDFSQAEAPALADTAPRPEPDVPIEPGDRAMDLGPEPVADLAPAAIDPAEEVAPVARVDRPAEAVAAPALPEPHRLVVRPADRGGRREFRPPLRNEVVAPLPDLDLPAPAIGPPMDLPDAGPSPGADEPAGAVSASPADPDAVGEAVQGPGDRPVEPPPLGLPEADLRVASRPSPVREPAARPSGRTAGLPEFDLGQVVPGTLPDLPDVWGTAGGRPLLDVPEVYRPRLDPNRSALARRAGASEASEQAVERALDWLARHQDADGRWDAATARFRDGSAAPGEDSFTAHCPPGDTCPGECYYWEADTAVTGLALLAFLGAGYTHADGKYAPVVGRGLEFLVKIQGPDGDLRGPSRSVGMYCHAMATLALSEAYALSGDPDLRGPVERGVGFLASARYPELMGWRYAPAEEIERVPSQDGTGFTYEPHPPVGDTSVLGWVVLVLKSASEVGVEVPSSAPLSARNWLNKVADGKAGGLARYQPSRPADPVMTAEAWVCRQFLGFGGPGPASAEAEAELLDHPPAADAANFYYWYYATLAMYQNGGPGWDRWNASIRDTLVGLQRLDGHRAGSWDPDPTRYGTHGGRVYSTALAALSLEVYYRYLRLNGPSGGVATGTATGPSLAPSPRRPGDAALQPAGGAVSRPFP